MSGVAAPDPTAQLIQDTAVTLGVGGVYKAITGLSATAGIDAEEAAATGVEGVAPSVIRAGDLKLPGVPDRAVGALTNNGKGLIYQIPRGTPELDSRVASICVAGPVTSDKYLYPNGYVSYLNSGGQVINPLTGETLQPSDPLWHIPLP